MTTPNLLVAIRHGTTFKRAQHLLSTFPDAEFIEPGGDRYSRAGGFSAFISGEDDVGLGSPARYAKMKASNFPNEGGPVILEVEVPAWIVDILRNDPFASMVLRQGHEINLPIILAEF